MRKTMKKVLLVCLALLACALMFTACDTGNEPQTPSGTTNGNITEDSTTDGATESETEAHVHSFGEWITVKEATCTEKGEQERVCACGEKETKSLDMVAHTEVIDEAVAPTCTETGLTEGKHCSVCNTVMTKQEVVKANGHTDGDWIVDKEATAKDDGAKHQICSVCKETLKSETLPATGSVGLAYELNTSGTGYIMTGIGACKDSEVYIPATYNGLPVTEIARRAFYKCDTVNEITIPSSVGFIGAQVFYKAQNLHTVYYNSAYSSKDNPLFKQTSVKKVVFGGNSVPSYIIPDCSNIQEVVIQEGVKTIGENAFSYCTGLITIEIPDSVTSINQDAFLGCSSLTSIVIPTSVTYIGAQAFIVLSDSTDVYINTSVWEKILKGESIFGDSINLHLIDGNGNEVTSWVIPDGVNTIKAYMFSQCTGLTSIVIPDSVTYIDNSAFSGCAGLATITIPDSVTQMGRFVFERCIGLTSVVIPDSVTEIPYFAFSGCSNLISITVPDSVTSMDKGAFSGCDSLTTIHFEGTLDQWNALSKWCAEIPTTTKVVCFDGTELSDSF